MGAGPAQDVGARCRSLGSYQTARTILQKLRTAMVRPGRDRQIGQGLADDRWALVLLRMWAQGVGHLEAIKQHGRSCRSCARPWFVPGEIVCAVRSRSMNPMWAVSHKAFADVVQTASLSWRSP